jgi:hypothetical protein
MPHRSRRKTLVVIATTAVLVLASSAYRLAQSDLLAQGDSAGDHDPGPPTTLTEAQAQLDPTDDPLLLLEREPDGTWGNSLISVTSPEAMEALVDLDIKTAEQLRNQLDEFGRRVQQLKARR